MPAKKPTAKTKVTKPVGRPPKYATPADLSAAIDAYFTEKMLTERPPTMVGLALWLDFQDYNSLREQAERKEDGPEFSRIVKKAFARVQEWHEERLSGNAPTGSIFWLKVHAGFKETQVTEHSGNVTIVDDIGRRG